MLRSEHGSASPAAWSVSIEVEPLAGLLPEWFEQETIRGDFLLAIRQFEMNQGEPLGLEVLLVRGHLAGALAAAAEVADRRSARRCCRDAAWLGIDLLSGEEAKS